MDLVDALSGNYQTGSVVETSLHPLFRRDYNSLYKAIQQYQPRPGSQSLAELAAPSLPRPEKRPFFLLGVDVTPQPRPYAVKLQKRECVYQPTPIRGQKPITYGHQYSDVCLLPEKEHSHSPHWVVPLANQRVDRANQVLQGARQIRSLLENRRLPFSKQLCVEVADSKYSTPEYLAANRDLTNLVTIARVRTNRHFYLPPQTESQPGKGHPRWYGKAMVLADPATHPEADLTVKITTTNHLGKPYRLEMTAWYDIRMKGKSQPQTVPMQDYPFTLVEINLYDAQNQPVYAKPLWLIVMGKRRQELSLQQIYEAYRQRYDLEHFFGFAKRRLLLDRYQTPEVEHEEHWWQLVHLAYLQLWVARDLAVSCPRPWERYLPQMKEKAVSPSMVQRSLGRIIRQLGTPASVPKRRGYSPGRAKGSLSGSRPDRPVHYKPRC